MGFMWGQQDLGVEVGCGVPGSGARHAEMELAYLQLWRKRPDDQVGLGRAEDSRGGGSREGVPCALATFWSVAWRQAQC